MKFNLKTLTNKNKIYICRENIIELTLFLTVNSAKVTLRKIPKFHPISWSENFVEVHSFCRVSGDSRKKIDKSLSVDLPRDTLLTIYKSFIRSFIYLPV